MPSLNTLTLGVAAISQLALAAPASDASSRLEARQGVAMSDQSCHRIQHSTDLVDDGWPQQDVYWAQVSVSQPNPPNIQPPTLQARTTPKTQNKPEQSTKLTFPQDTIECRHAGGACSLEREDVDIKEWSASISLTGVKGYEWISGGFEVSQSHSTGSSKGCEITDGEKAWAVCMWKSMDYTRVRLEPKIPFPPSFSFPIFDRFSPNMCVRADGLFFLSCSTGSRTGGRKSTTVATGRRWARSITFRARTRRTMASTSAGIMRIASTMAWTTGMRTPGLVAPSEVLAV